PFENLREQFARIALVVDDEHPHVVETLRLGSIGGTRQRARRRDIARRAAVGRQQHAERRAAPLARAVHTDGPAVELDEVTHDREPETEAAVSAPRAGFTLPEA